MKRSLLALLIAFIPAATLAQPRFGAVPDSGRHEPTTPSSSTSGARFSAGPSGDVQAERCKNFRREMRSARRQEREAGTTGSSDQASARRQALLEQMQREGC